MKFLGYLSWIEIRKYLVNTSWTWPLRFHYFTNSVLFLFVAGMFWSHFTCFDEEVGKIFYCLTSNLKWVLIQWWYYNPWWKAEKIFFISILASIAPFHGLHTVHLSYRISKFNLYIGVSLIYRLGSCFFILFQIKRGKNSMKKHLNLQRVPAFVDFGTWEKLCYMK